MNTRFVQFLIHSMLILAVLALIGFNALLFWVATGPRSLDGLTPYIEEALTPQKDFSVKIKETMLIWDGWKHPISVRLHDVSVLTKDGKPFSSFPEISVGLDVFHLFLGQVLPTSLTINHPVLSLYQNEDNSITFGFNPDNTPPAANAAAPPPSNVPALAVFMPAISNDPRNSMRKLRFVTVRNANVSIGSTAKGIFMEAKNVDLSLKRSPDGFVEILTSANLLYDAYQSPITGNLLLKDGEKTMSGQLTFEGVMPGVLAPLFMENDSFKAADLPLSGSIKFILGMDGVPEYSQFSILGGQGSIHYDKLANDLPIAALSITGETSKHLNEIHISNLLVNIDQMAISGEGSLTRQDGDFATKASLHLEHAKASDIAMLWPPSLSPESRKWVTTNITSGLIPKVDTEVNIQLGDLGKPVLPKEAIGSSIYMEKAAIRYLPEHPEVTNVKGVVHVDGVSLDADIESADFLKDSHLSNGHLLIADLNQDNPRIAIDFDAATNAKDAVAFLKLPRVNHAGHLNLDAATAEGTATVAAKLAFDFFAPHDAAGNPQETDIDYDITAQLKNIAQANFLKRFDLANINGALTVNETGVGFKGAGQVNGAEVSEGEVQYISHPQDGFGILINAVGTAPVEVLPRFGYPAFPFLKGTLGIKAALKEADKSEVSTATVDFTNATIHSADINWNKPDKEPATLTITAEKKDGVARISNFTYKGEKADVKGSAELTPDMSNIQRAEIKPLLLGDTSLEHFIFERMEGGFKLDLSGASADLTAWLAGDPKEPSHFSFQHFPAVNIKADVARVIIAPKREISQAKMILDCTTHICNNASVSAIAAGKPFYFRILHNPKGIRQLSLHAEDAGSFLKSLNLTDYIEGGDLTITGNYNDSKSDASVLRGRADITDHDIKGAPVLAKILSLASLTGFIDSLEGKGISFHRLSAPFVLSNDVITIEKAKTYGPSIGLTLEGNITMPAGTLNLEGTVVPAYSLNTVLGKVPLLGTLLTGGEGQGVFAARYSVTGTYKEPEVSVNPLSMLTPGFLRGLFDIFDKSEPEPVPPDTE